MTGRCVVRDL